MEITQEDIQQLKLMYLKRFRVKISDEEALALGIRLLSLVKIVAKPIPQKKQTKLNF